MIEIQNLSKNYIQAGSIINVLSNINLSVSEAEIIAIVGASGSGKSTLLHHIGLLDKPSSGKIFISGKEAVHSNDKVRSYMRLNTIGFIYQYHHLLRDFTALENIILPQLILGRNLNDSTLRAQELMHSLALSEKSCNYPGELSGGQQQRVAIARALANKPKILLADEPTGNLDSANAELVFNILLENARKSKVTTVIVTHNNDLANLTDKVYLIKDGILVER